MRGMSVLRFFASRLAVICGRKNWRGTERSEAWEPFARPVRPLHAAQASFFLCAGDAVDRGQRARHSMLRHYKSVAVSSEPSIPRAPLALWVVIITKCSTDSQICRWKRGTWHSHHRMLVFHRSSISKYVRWPEITESYRSIKGSTDIIRQHHDEGGLDCFCRVCHERLPECRYSCPLNNSEGLSIDQ